MRIGVDARELVGKVTGVGKYLSGLLQEWQSSGATMRHQFVLYAPSALPDELNTFDVRVLPGAGGTWWQQTTLSAAARRDALDVFFAPQYTAPLALNVPLIVVIFDVSFAAHPEWFRAREGLRLRTLARCSAHRARRIVTISNFSREEIAEHLGVDVRRIDVVPPGIPAHTRAVSPKNEPRLLYVGSVFNRRHVPDLIRAFAAAARSHPDASLDIVGDNRTYPFVDIAASVANEQLDDRIRWHRYTNDAQLAELYKRARAFAFLSEYEGLGMTPLEALAAGAPSVLYDTPISHETCGTSALYVRPGDNSSTARALEALLFDQPTRAHLLAQAPAQLAHYNWPRAAAATLNLIETCR